MHVMYSDRARDEVGSVEHQAIRKIAVRLVPLVAAMFVVYFLERTAISLAGPNGLNRDLGLTAAQFGFASGIFSSALKTTGLMPCARAEAATHWTERG